MKRFLASIAVFSLLMFAVPLSAQAPDVTVVGSGTGDTQAVTTVVKRAWLVGFSITEDTGSATARVRIYHGTSASGVELFDVTLAANESTREWFGYTGPFVGEGIFIDRVSGTTRLTIYTRPY